MSRTQTAPRARIAIIGASNDRRKFGNKAVRAFRDRGYTVFPINPRERSIEGLPAFASVREVPQPLDIVSIYVQADVGLALIDDVAEVRPGEVWINPGAESAALVARARTLGLQPIVACSIMGIGESPSEF